MTILSAEWINNKKLVSFLFLMSNNNICSVSIFIFITAGLAKSLARRPGAIVLSSRATKMYHCPARRATLNTGLPQVLNNSSI